MGKDTKITRRRMLRNTVGMTAGVLAGGRVNLVAAAETRVTATLDHIHIGCANVYTTAFDLTKTTKIGHYDGGFTGNVTIGQKTMPIGSGVYIEIESIVDPFATKDASKRPWWYTRALAMKSPIFSGVCLRVNTMDELREIAARHGGAIKSNVRTPPDGPQVKFSEAPSGVPGISNAWQSGKPTWCCWEDRLYMHPSGQPVVNAPGLVEPMRVAWMEMGGTKTQMQQWLGQNPDDLKIRFNRKTPGLYAIGVSTDAGEVEIRLPSATGGNR